jgi:hypothetical protein
LEEKIETNPEKINWIWLSFNPSAIPLLEVNPDKIDWDMLSKNPSAIPLLKAHLKRINWEMLSENKGVTMEQIKFDIEIPTVD